jgi:peptide/nickel transport system substrate-binding protein
MLAGRCQIGSASADFRGLISGLLEARANGVLNPSITSSTSFEHLDFGITSAEDYERALGTDLFQDVRMRQAIAYCLDRPALVNELLYGVAEVPNTYVPNSHPLYAGEAVVAYAFDPPRAALLMKRVGAIRWGWGA